MESLNLFMVLVGCKPKGRHTEQHDVFFTIGKNLKEIVPQIKSFWKDSGSMHLDAWREVTHINGFHIAVEPKKKKAVSKSEWQLFFINLGGYKPEILEEFHYKMLVIAKTKAEAIRSAKETAFYKHTGFKGAASHIDDKYGIDIDDIYQIEDILPKAIKKAFEINIQPQVTDTQDKLHIGYTMLSKIK